MPLIKHDKAKPLASRAVVLDLGDLDRQAQAIIEEAQREAAAILERAQAEAQQLVDTADERGYAVGHERGLTEGRAEGEAAGRAAAEEEHGARFETLAESWSTALARWESELDGQLLAARDEVLAFAVALARKIVLRVSATDPGIVEEQLAEVLGLLGRSASITVVINPADRPVVERVLPTLLERLTGCRYGSIEEDETVTRGGCLVRTPGGSVDATIETQLERIAEVLLPSPSGVTGGGAE